MVIKGKLVIDFIKGDTEKKEVKFWEESDKFLKSKNKYFLSIISLMIIIQSHPFTRLLMVNIYEN